MKENINPIINQISIYNINRQSLEIDKWRNALNAAESVHYPQRKALYDIYHDLLLDAHLNAIYKKRIRNIINTPVSYCIDGVVDKKSMEHLAAPWFTRTVEIIMETVFWGHSLIEFSLKKGYVDAAILIPRHHVNPTRGIVATSSPYSTTGIQYRDEPYSRYTLEISLPDQTSFYGLGLLNVAAANTILKRNGAIDFANFVEMFGSPIREYEYDPSIPFAKEEAERVAKDSGNSAAILVPKGYAQLKLHQGANQSSQELHVNFLQQLKSELTVLILGQTMTTENGSSRSQAEVHERAENDVTAEDRLFVEYVLNWELKEKLIGMGLPISPKGMFSFDIEQGLSIKEQLEMELKIAGQYHVPASFFSEKYGIPVQDKPLPVAPIGEKKKP